MSHKSFCFCFHYKGKALSTAFPLHCLLCAESGPALRVLQRLFIYLGKEAEIGENS